MSKPLNKMDLFKKEDAITVMSFQHKDVLKELNTNDIYICNRKSDWFNKTPNSYMKLMESFPNKYIENLPIFGWANIVISEDNHGINLTNDYIKRAQNMTGFNSDNYIGMILDIPKSYLAFQDFYNFVDCRCEEEGIDTFGFDVWGGTILNYPIGKDILKNRDIQCVMPCIKKEWIRVIFKYEYKTEIDMKKEHPYSVKVSHEIITDWEDIK